MIILFFCTRWGQEHIPWTDFCKNVKNAGYDGVETSLPTDENEVKQIVATLHKFGLQLIAVQWDTVTPDFNKHTEEYQWRLKLAAGAKPLFVTSHTGKDFFNFQQNEQLLNLSKQISDTTGITILHETHRGKFSFAAHITEDYLKKLPWINLTLDISHWFAVAESYLTDQQAAVNLAIAHTAHIHARIGYAHGPQVSDPQSAEWQEIVDIHLKLWDKVVEVKKNDDWLTITPEFGPFPYLQLQPYTGVPLASQWDVNLYMLNMLKTRYQNYI